MAIEAGNVSISSAATAFETICQLTLGIIASQYFFLVSSPLGELVTFLVSNHLI